MNAPGPANLSQGTGVNLSSVSGHGLKVGNLVYMVIALLGVIISTACLGKHSYLISIHKEVMFF
jgi:hypothetical protein